MGQRTVGIDFAIPGVHVARIRIARRCVDTGGRDTGAVYGHLRRLRGPRIARTKGIDVDPCPATRPTRRRSWGHGVVEIEPLDTDPPAEIVPCNAIHPRRRDAQIRIGIGLQDSAGAFLL